MGKAKEDWDLLTLYPRRYVSYPEPKTVAGLQEGEKAAAVLSASATPIMTGKTARIQGRDSTGTINLCWFHLPYRTIRRGETLVFYGDVSSYNGIQQMVQPAVYGLDEYEEKRAHLEPVYPLRSGMTQKRVRKAVDNALGMVTAGEYLTDAERGGLIPLGDAIQQIHHPHSQAEADAARERLKFEELADFLSDARFGTRCAGVEFTVTGAADRAAASLPWPLTDGQHAAWGDIRGDLTSGRRMVRLLQGDVGCGKTVLAFLAMVLAAENGYQSVLVAPTEVLAQQHYDSLCRFLHGNMQQCVLLTGASKCRGAYEGIADGTYRFIVGTHAVLQDSVSFHNLGLVTVDEEHRFGVGQRGALGKRVPSVHTLIMSATPIPRSLAKGIYGDVDVSQIHGKPADRLPLKNAVITPGDRETAWRFIYGQVLLGHQAYVICPMVEEGVRDAAYVTGYVQGMRRHFPPDVHIAALYGKMDGKQAVMDAFRDGEIQILVSTTVVEVGVNVPNATVIMVEDAHLFGMAQLHQLRGRVGRGRVQGFCIMVDGSGGRCERLDVMKHTNDGFAIAEKDMEMRGVGQMAGVRQSGWDGMRLADVFGDSELLERVSALLHEIGGRRPGYMRGIW